MTMPSWRRPSLPVKSDDLRMPFWIVDDTLAPAVMAPRNSKMTAMNATCILV